MTKQEMFDTVARHLIAQGRPAMVDGECKYRAADGAKCAAGCLIPEDKYRQSMEGWLVQDEPVRCVLVDLGFGEEGLAFLRELQSAHDAHSESADWLARWKTRMLQIAATNELDASVLA